MRLDFLFWLVYLLLLVWSTWVQDWKTGPWLGPLDDEASMFPPKHHYSWWESIAKPRKWRRQNSLKSKAGCVFLCLSVKDSKCCLLSLVGLPQGWLNLHLAKHECKIVLCRVSSYSLAFAGVRNAKRIRPSYMGHSILFFKTIPQGYVKDKLEDSNFNRLIIMYMVSSNMALCNSWEDMSLPQGSHNLETDMRKTTEKGGWNDCR